MRSWLTKTIEVVRTPVVALGLALAVFTDWITLPNESTAAGDGPHRFLHSKKNVTPTLELWVVGRCGGELQIFGGPDWFEPCEICEGSATIVCRGHSWKSGFWAPVRQHRKIWIDLRDSEGIVSDSERDSVIADVLNRYSCGESGLGMMFGVDFDLQKLQLAGSHHETHMHWAGVMRNGVSTFLAAMLIVSISATPTWLRAARGRVRVRQGRCASCGYDMRGLASDICPECGASHSSSNFEDR